MTGAPSASTLPVFLTVTETVCGRFATKRPSVTSPVSMCAGLTPSTVSAAVARNVPSVAELIVTSYSPSGAVDRSKVTCICRPSADTDSGWPVILVVPCTNSTVWEVASALPCTVIVVACAAPARCGVTPARVRTSGPQAGLTQVELSTNRPG